MSWFKTIIVIMGALTLTALGIDAADTASGGRTTLLAAIFQTTSVSECPAGMVLLKNTNIRVCIDAFEASVGEECSIKQPESLIDTLANMTQSNCLPQSKSGQLPWRYVSYRTAQQLCAKTGKQLVSPIIWYQAALGTADTSTACGISGELSSTGSHGTCQSGIGAFDMVGNVWELVQDEVVDGTLGAQSLPVSGYVTAITDAGLPRTTATAPSALYGNDYFSANATGTSAILRGGYYNGGSDAGLYNTQTAITQDFASAAVGFRCMLVL